MKKQQRYICGCHPKANDDNCLNLKGHGLFESDFQKHTPISVAGATAIRAIAQAKGKL